jgi:glycosyltransferase involved in cell wall biosynthesis
MTTSGQTTQGDRDGDGGSGTGLLCSIVVPVYNESESIRPLVEEIDAALAILDRRYEVILVDDGSTDGSDQVMRELAERGDEQGLGRVRALSLATNVGQSAALVAGFAAVRAPVVVTLDADLQNDPADIPLFLERLQHADVVSGIRDHRQDDWRRRVASQVANAVRRLVLHDSITDVGCSIKAYRAETLRGIPFFDGIHRFLPSLLECYGLQVVEVTVRHRPRKFGVSKYTIRGRLGRGLLDLMGVRWLIARRIVTCEVEEGSTACQAPGNPGAGEGRDEQVVVA